MPIKTIRVRTSSLSGKEMAEGTGGRVRIKVDGKVFVADLTDAELRQLVKDTKAEAPAARKKAASGTKRTRRGKKTTAAARKKAAAAVAAVPAPEPTEPAAAPAEEAVA